MLLVSSKYYKRRTRSIKPRKKVAQDTNNQTEKRRKKQRNKT
jgi:hypothetical protein